MLNANDEKWCRDCEKWKHKSQFYRDARHADGLQVYCKPCNSKRTIASQLKRYGSHRAHWLMRKYGLTEADYDRMLAAQGGRCAICGATESGNAKHPVLFVDHDHATGKTRALLCHACNVMVGHAKDNPLNLINGIHYLNKHKEENDGSNKYTYDLSTPDNAKRRGEGRIIFSDQARADIYRHRNHWTEPAPEQGGTDTDESCERPNPYSGLPTPWELPG